ALTRAPSWLYMALHGEKLFLLFEIRQRLGRRVVVADFVERLLWVQRERQLVALDRVGGRAALCLRATERLMELIRLRQQREAECQHFLAVAGFLAVRCIRRRLQ